MNIFLIILFINSINSQLNLYLDSNSVQQLFGSFYTFEEFLNNIFFLLNI
jgi:hypothetical protein